MPIDRDRWAEIEPLLDEALDLPLEEREGWLRHLRLRDATLAAAVEELLARDTGPETSWPDLDARTLLGRPSGLVGQAIGPYTVERLLGRGGMGSVWLARRHDGRFEGQVAIKLLNLALVGQAAERRFQQEGTLLARLQHPHIARMLDAGVTDAGQPYLVLEYVEGERIDTWADRLRLDVRQRLVLFQDVLAAVTAAHNNLVVHRDLKPSNVMVAADGSVKLLDFGIATILDEAREAGGAVTETAHRAFTPEYAAPEVILGRPVSTATDVYSLGVMLYVLLAGRHPLGGRFDTTEALLASLTARPTRLSAAMAQASDDPSLPELAVARSATPEKLRRLFVGDLENILDRALRKDPAERYQSAAALAEDVSRHLTNRPVSARPDHWVYPTRKFLRRNRGAVVAGVLVALSLLSGTGLALRQMTLAERERDRAREALRRSAASVSFESLLFRLMDQDGESFTYQELLERARQALDREFQADPIARMQLSVQFAQNDLRRDDVESALVLLERSRAIADSLGGSEWQARTRCELAAALARTGTGADSALALVRAAAGLLDRLPEVERGTANACDSGAGDAWLMLGRPDSAASRFQAVVRRWEVDGDTLDERYLIALNNTGRALFGAGRVREAVAVTARVLEMGRRGLSSDPWSRVATLVNLEIAQGDLGEFRSSRELLGRALGDPAGPDSVASRAPLIMSRYARVLLELGEADSARSWIDRALLREADLGPIWSVDAHVTAARVAAARGDPARFALHRDAVRRLGQRLNTGARDELGLLELLSAPDTGQALATSLEATLVRLGLGEGPPREALLVDHLLVAAGRLNDVGRFGPATRYAALAAELASVDSIAATRSGLVGRARLEQARAAAAEGNHPAARALATEALPPLRAGFGPEHGRVAEALRLAGTEGARRSPDR